jgi:phosphoserine aminotransferase
MKALLSEGNGHLRHKIVEEEANNIAQRVDADLAHFFVDGLSTEGVSTRQTMFRECARILLALKFELLLADKEYEIHFVEAGSQFDLGTMIAVSHDGTVEERGPQSTVQFCVYPALLQYDSSAVSNAKDFSAVLLCNKSFYPGNLPRRNALLVAKATVVLA